MKSPIYFLYLGKGREKSSSSEEREGIEQTILVTDCVSINIERERFYSTRIQKLHIFD